MTDDRCDRVRDERPIVIAGAGLAGLRTAEELRAAGYEGGLVLVGDEFRLPYDRPPLSKQFVRGEIDDTTLRPSEFFTEHDIRLRLDAAATAVDTVTRRVRLADGSELDYSQLVIATGLRPRRIATIDGIPGVHVLRSHNDAVAVRARLAAAERALIVGAGFIGCELAASLRSRGMGVVVVEPAPTPLAAALGPWVGELVARLHRAEGVELHCGVGVDAVITEGGAVRGARLTDGSRVQADLVVVGIGSVPATGWLEGSGVPLAESGAGGGVLADEVGRTAVDGVWAVGDVAAWWHPHRGHRRVEHWTNAGEQARILARALLGVESSAAAEVPYVWSDQYGLRIQVLGTPTAADTVRIVEDDGRRFLAHYLADGVLTAVVGAGMAGKVMKARARLVQSAALVKVSGDPGIPTSTRA
ncbi:FAD/NAD(P)-binding oxidoreductase [Nocardia sp. NPDC006630]|uniref:NAD(P)/FAD-dependent oxidoreductase n=1 Tax=Nocardia sp. NPDC006630 TaxID=3157181 RepID=UPI0033B2B25F